MVHIEGQIDIHRPVEEVFDFVAAETNEPLYNPRMRKAEKLTDGPTGVGARFRTEIMSWGSPAEMTVEFTGYDRPRRLASTTTTSVMDVQGELTFERTPEGTRMCWSWNIDAHGCLRYMGPLVAYLGRKQERNTWSNLKRLLEEKAGVVASTDITEAS